MSEYGDVQQLDVSRLRAQMEERQALRQEWERRLAGEGMPSELPVRDVPAGLVVDGEPLPQAALAPERSTCMDRTSKSRRRVIQRTIVRWPDGRRSVVRGDGGQSVKMGAEVVGVVPRRFLTRWERRVIEAHDREMPARLGVDAHPYVDAGPFVLEPFVTRSAVAPQTERDRNMVDINEWPCTMAALKSVDAWDTCRWASHRNKGCMAVTVTLQGEYDVALNTDTRTVVHTCLVR